MTFEVDKCCTVAYCRTVAAKIAISKEKIHNLQISVLKNYWIISLKIFERKSLK